MYLFRATLTLILTLNYCTYLTYHMHATLPSSFPSSATPLSCSHYYSYYPFILVGWMTSLLLETNTPHPCPCSSFSTYILSALSFPSMFSPFPYSSICPPLAPFSFTSSLYFPISNFPQIILLILSFSNSFTSISHPSPLIFLLSDAIFPISHGLPFSLTSLPFYHLPSPLPLLRPSSSPGPSPPAGR